MKRKFVQIENKNAIVELLEEGKTFEKILLANNAYKDDKTKHIVNLAGKRRIPVERVSRKSINRRSNTSSTESCIALMEVDNQYSLEGMMMHIRESGYLPNILIFSDVRYPQNIGAIFRTAYAAGVNGIITPVMKENILSDEIIRISMGTCLRIPICEVNLFAAIKRLKKEGAEILGLDMNGSSIYDTDLTGAKAFIVGSEDLGVTPKAIERCDKLISIPMREGLGSLNVGVSAGVVLYEKVRQEFARS
ncbi:MAG: 23S rRNA (guanosine(2251)-2'-O)-methyltransferase RlmB [Candidatus Dojkabacteria bacterium]